MSVCGTMGGEPLYTMLLLGLGLRQLSMPPHQLPEIKRVIRGIRIETARAVAAEALRLETAQAVAALLETALRRALPDTPAPARSASPSRRRDAAAPAEHGPTDPTSQRSARRRDSGARTRLASDDSSRSAPDRSTLRPPGRDRTPPCSPARPDRRIATRPAGRRGPATSGLATQPHDMTTATKLRLRFAKRGDLRLVSHHDLMRCLERMLRRAQIPMAMSQGFNPRPKIVFALALGLGIEGRREVVDLELAEPMEPAERAAAAGGRSPRRASTGSTPRRCPRPRRPRRPVAVEYRAGRPRRAARRPLGRAWRRSWPARAGR